jgi:sigma-B regulation protein RsbU (phosphoserine phosphatase)
METQPGTAMGFPALQERTYRLHSRIRTVALVITVFLVIVEALLVWRISEQPYSGITLKNITVARVAGQSPAAEAGLRKGDEVIRFGGVTCGSLRDISECLARVSPGDRISYSVRRNGRTIDIPVTFARLPLSEILRKALLLVVGFSFIAIGLVVYFRRADKVALVFYLLWFAFGVVLTNVVNFELATAHNIYRSAFNDLLVLSLPALFLHFFLLFPERNKKIGDHPRLEYLLYCPLVVLFAVSSFFNVMVFSHGRTYGRALAAFQGITAVYFVVFFVAGLLAFVHAYRQVRREGIKGKLRLVVWGTILGTLPLATVNVVLGLRPAIEIPGEKLAFLPLILVPMTFGHAIVRHGLFDLEIVFKRSLVYTLLIAVLASVYFAVVYGIGRLASRFIGSADLLFSIISIFVITLLISPLRARIRSAVDRTFFRDEYNYRKIIKQISHSLAGIISLESLVSFVAIRVQEVLGAGTVVVFMLDQRIGKYTARYGIRVNHTMVRGFGADGTLADMLRRTQTTFNVQRRLESKRPLALSVEESETLLSVEAALVVPFIFKSHLLGFMSIGTKTSDEFYSSTHAELLETLCDQVSLAIENARLYLETVEKQKMEQELEVAKEIQKRLLPKAFPQIPGVQSRAMNLPSKHVGGDYYDIIPLSATRVAAIIADVSGKGVPAALLMASLQSSLRAEADAGRSPSGVISILNREIYEHTSGGTFVTVFYGIIDFEKCELVYCNAGQSPPVILGRDLTVKMLDDTDIVIGIDASATYRDRVVELKAGDLLFLYTDGITDELDQNDEPFGETSLVANLRQVYDRDLGEILNQVHGAVMEHTGGQPQDDLTALAIRIEAFAPLAQGGTIHNKSLNLPPAQTDI